MKTDLTNANRSDCPEPILDGKRRPPAPSGHRRVPAFTLIELLVVMAIIAILAGLLLAGLEKAKSKAQGVACLSNLQQQQLGWLLYCDNNNDAIPPFIPMIPDPGDRATHATSSNSWIVGNGWTDTTSSNLLRSRSFEYVRSPRLYRCPGDRSTVQDSTLIPRTRSYSVSWYMGMHPERGSPYYRNNWHRLDDIRRPGPSQAFVYADEHENSVSVGLFGVNHTNELVYWGSNAWTWGSFPATRHNNAGTVSFADGHAEIWSWRERNTRAIARRKGGWTGALCPPAVANTDRDLGRFFAAIPEKVPIP